MPFKTNVLREEEENDFHVRAFEMYGDAGLAGKIPE
jgi:hypothetical protein